MYFMLKWPVLVGGKKLAKDILHNVTLISQSASNYTSEM